MTARPVPERAWRVVYPKPITLEAAQRVASNARCAACDGRLIIDHDEDDHGNGRLHCLMCGHEAADVKLEQS